MKAKLVKFVFKTKVIVDDDATDDQITEAAIKNMMERFGIDHEAFCQIKSELNDNFDLIADDTIAPYDKKFDFPGQFGYHSKQKQYWIAHFSNYTIKKWELSEDQTIEQAIKNYLHRQNAGEAKSDRMYLYEKWQVSHDEFLNHQAHLERY